MPSVKRRTTSPQSSQLHEGVVLQSTRNLATPWLPPKDSQHLTNLTVVKLIPGMQNVSRIHPQSTPQTERTPSILSTTIARRYKSVPRVRVRPSRSTRYSSVRLSTPPPSQERPCSENPPTSDRAPSHRLNRASKSARLQLSFPQHVSETIIRRAKSCPP